jgi:aldose 1-epimerase
VRWFLDERGLPTNVTRAERAETAPIARRTLDDLYALGRRPTLSLAVDDASIELRCDAGYRFAQVWVPAGRPFVALEPMTAPTNALVTGDVETVAPGEEFAARFTLAVR